MNTSDVRFEQVFAKEIDHIQEKRDSIHEEATKNLRDNLFGIALSGGGIRSATINAGFLEVLNRCGILRKADYLSTVSGGGYTGGYIQSKLHRTPEGDSLFSVEDLKYLQSHGDYLTPGRRFVRVMTKVRLTGAFVASLVMNWVWIFLAALIVGSFIGLIADQISESVLTDFLYGMVWLGLGVLLIHYFFHFLRHAGLWRSDALSALEGLLLVLIVVSWILRLSVGTGVFSLSTAETFLASVLALAVTGLFGNPNILSMHRYYRDRISQAFLDAGGKGSDRIRLHELGRRQAANTPDCRPYPLINTCLNLLSWDDPKFPGAKVSDYFLLSPNYVGSKTTGYMKTDDPLYRTLTLSTAVAISGAALNPNMGTRTNRILTFLMALLNLQLGYWGYNPAYRNSNRLRITWWPYYHLLQLLCRTDSTRLRINLSDGGHIENLAVYELLRRRAKLIVAIDAGDDPRYEFSDLKNLLIRARNELGVTITFRKGHRPEDRIKPSASSGFSEAHFAIADLGELTGKAKKGEEYKGVLAYVKSSLVEPERWRDLKPEDPDYWSFTYKTLHPDFPHESTADQFFDDDQWEAYYKLGRFMAGDLLDVDLRDSEEFAAKAAKLHSKSIDGLFRFFSTRT